MKISKEKHLNNAGKLSVGVIIAMAAVAVVALIFIAGGGFSKTVHKTFDSPKKYFSYVEKQAILGKKDSSVLSRVNDASEFYTNTDRYLKEEITLTVGEKGESYLRLLKETGVDLSWLTSAGIAYTVNSKDNNLEVKSTITLNEKEIISPEVILDSQKKAIYAKIPELAKDYAKYDLEEYGEKFDEFLEMAEKMKAAYPDSKDMKKLLTKYVKLVLDNVENVERTRGAVLECDEVSQKCTLLTVTLKEEDCLKILKAVCSEAVKDENLKKIYMDFGQAAGQDEDDVEKSYDDMIEELEKMSNVEELHLRMEKLVIELYVDGDGKIVGRVYNFVDEDGDKTSVKLAMATKGSKAGFELSVKDDETTAKMAGTGKLSGGKVTGDYALKVNGEKILTLSVEKFDLSAFEKGNLKGHFTCQFEGDEGLGLLPRTLQRYTSTFSALSPGFDLICDITDKKHEIDLGVLTNEEELFRIKLKGSIKSGTKVKIPGKAVDVTDQSDLKGFLEGMNWDKVLDALESADVPKSYREMLNRFQ